MPKTDLSQRSNIYVHFNYVGIYIYIYIYTYTFPILIVMHLLTMAPCQTSSPKPVKIQTSSLVESRNHHVLSSLLTHSPDSNQNSLILYILY